MFERRNLRVVAYATLGLFGAIAILIVPLLAFGHADFPKPLAVRIVAVTVAAALAVTWGCVFAARAHFAMDEFQRQREISVWFWGGWMGVAASAPVYCFVAAGGLHLIDPAIPAGPHLLTAFVLGYVLPLAGAVTGVIVALIWRRVTTPRRPVEP